MAAMSDSGPSDTTDAYTLALDVLAMRFGTDSRRPPDAWWSGGEAQRL